MTRVRDHQSPSEQAANAMLDSKDERIRELLEANNRFEQRGRMAERVVKFLESCLLDGNFGPTRESMARHLILEYRKDFPRS
jgi:hypothetical protein